MPCASRSLIFNSIAGDTLVTDLESRAFKGGWGFTNLVGGVDQVPDIDRAVLLKKFDGIERTDLLSDDEVRRFLR